MQRLTTALQQAVVGGVLDQRVLEAIFGPRRSLTKPQTPTTLLRSRPLTYTVERAMDPAAPPQPYRLSAELRFDDMDSASHALQAHGAETQADILNFTDVTPVILIGEVYLG